VLILFGSPVVGWLIGRLWAALLPAIPWAATLALIYVDPAEGELVRGGAAIMWSFLFAFLTALVVTGVVIRSAPSLTGRLPTTPAKTRPDV
jgi:hypothetical protein